MHDHPAPRMIAPVGADLRVVAQVRMLTPARRVASMRVAMRVRVTEHDEDVRSLARAIKAAVRTMALAALLVAALFAAGVQAAPVMADPVAPAPVDAVAMPWSVVAESHRTPRPALAATVVPSPD